MCGKLWILRWSMSTHVVWGWVAWERFFFLMRLQFKGGVLLLMANSICINSKFFSNTWLDAWDILNGIGQSVANHFLMHWMPKTMPPFFLPKSSSSLLSPGVQFPKLYVQYRTAKLCSLSPPQFNCPHVLLSRHSLLKTFLTWKKKNNNRNGYKI